MSRPKHRLRGAVRAALQPLAGAARRLLTPPPEPVQFQWHTLREGPAAGCQMYLPGGSDLAEKIVSGTYETRCIELLQRLVGASDTCLDIGGHYGYYAMNLARMVPAGHVHCFEPVAEHADRIRQSATRSSLGNVTVHTLAIAGEEGEMALRLAASPSADDSMAHLETYGGVITEAAAEQYPHFARRMVPTRTLDSLCEHQPRFIKIDAEGAEVAILAAGRRMIADHQPRLLVEVHGIREALQCAETMRSLDYRALIITPQQTTLPILWVPRGDTEAVQAAREIAAPGCFADL